MVKWNASVAIDTAAELANVDVLTIRKWSADGLLEIERRGGMEVVCLPDVDALASWETSRKKTTRRGTIRGLLRETTRVEPLDVSELQKLVRDRTS